MRMCASDDILQDIVDNILGDIEGIKTYINGILVLSKESFYNHIEKTMIIFGRLRTVVLKVNATK